MEILENKYGFDYLDYNTTLHRELNYKREQFNNPDDIVKWKEQGYTHTHFTGEMYDMKNAIPEWFDFAAIQKHFDNWTDLTWSFYKMTTGVILPEHIDTFKYYKTLYQNTKGKLGRIVIFLENWQPGHYFDISGESVGAWTAGDYAWFTENTPHTAANIGKMDRYTLQLTGFMNENTQ